MHQLHLDARRAPTEAPRTAAEITLRARQLARLQARTPLRERAHDEPMRPRRSSRAVGRPLRA